MSKLRNGGMISKNEYVGKTLEEATRYAKEGGFSTRIVEKNGIPEMLDMSVNAERLNFRIKGDYVIDVFGG